jgi:photosystem II stability/assembly factor-like uncharacterized protein
VDIDELIREADPVQRIEAVSAESDSAQELLQQIMAGRGRVGISEYSNPPLAGGVPGPGSADRGSHPRGISWTRLLVAAAVIVVIAGVGIATLSQGVRNNAHRPVATMEPVPMNWRLVSSVGPRIQPFESGRSSPQGLRSLECPTTQVCYLIASTSSLLPPNAAYRSTDGGATWGSLALPPGVFLDTPFSCFSAVGCMVGAELGLATGVGGSNVPQLLLTTDDGGASWTTHQVPMSPIQGADAFLNHSIAGMQGAFYDLDCFSATSCIAFGTTPTGQAEGGSNGTNFVSLTVAMRTNDAGASWSTYVFPWSTTPSGAPGWANEEVTSFSCSTPQICVGLADVLGAPESSSASRSEGTYGNQQSSLLEFRTNDGGSTWSHQWVSNFEGSTSSLTCPDQSHCYAITNIGALGAYGPPAILSTYDDGTTWTVAQPFLPPNPRWDGLSSISCPTVNACWIAGSDQSSTNPRLTQGAMFASLNGGRTWLPVQLPAGLGSVSQVECVTVRSCLAIGQPPVANGTVTSRGPIPTDVLTNRAADR